MLDSLTVIWRVQHEHVLRGESLVHLKQNHYLGVQQKEIIQGLSERIVVIHKRLRSLPSLFMIFYKKTNNKKNPKTRTSKQYFSYITIFRLLFLIHRVLCYMYLDTTFRCVVLVDIYNVNSNLRSPMT